MLLLVVCSCFWVIGVVCLMGCVCVFCVLIVFSGLIVLCVDGCLMCRVGCWWWSSFGRLVWRFVIFVRWRMNW